MPTSARHHIRAVLPLAVLALGAAACGGGGTYKNNSAADTSNAPTASTQPSPSADGGYDSYGSSGTSTSTATAGAAVVAVARDDRLGQVLVDGTGRTLYLFEKDKPDMSSCSGGCVNVWPPLGTKGAPTAGAGATATLLSSFSRADGSIQVTYSGHALYYYIADGEKAGSTVGQGLDQFGANWYVLSPDGKKKDEPRS